MERQEDDGASLALIDAFTGTVLDPDDLAALEDAEVRLDIYLRNFGPLYGVRSDLRTRIAEVRKMAKLPPPRFRTDIQHRVSTCPRCSAKQ